MQRGLPLVVAPIHQLGIRGDLPLRLLVHLLLHAARPRRIRPVPALFRLHGYHVAFILPYHRHHRLPRLLVVRVDDLWRGQGRLESRQASVVIGSTDYGRHTVCMAAEC